MGGDDAFVAIGVGAIVMVLVLLWAALGFVGGFFKSSVTTKHD